eukprot:s1571_g4.t1
MLASVCSGEIGIKHPASPRNLPQQPLLLVLAPKAAIFSWRPPPLRQAPVGVPCLELRYDAVPLLPATASMPKGSGDWRRYSPVALLLVLTGLAGTPGALGIVVHRVWILQNSVARLRARLDQLAEALAKAPRGGSMLSVGRGPEFDGVRQLLCWSAQRFLGTGTQSFGVGYRRPSGSTLDWGKELQDIHRRRFGDGLRRPTRYHDDDFDGLSANFEGRDWYLPPADIDLGGPLYSSWDSTSYSPSAELRTSPHHRSLETSGRELRQLLTAAAANRTAHLEAFEWRDPRPSKEDQWTYG